MHFDARGLPISTASGKAAAACDYLVTGSLTQIMRHVPVTVDCSALDSLVDCAFCNEGATLRSYLVTLARINV
jgi:hypothetical protein